MMRYNISYADKIYELALEIFNRDEPDLKEVIYDNTTQGFFISNIAFLLYSLDDFSKRFGETWIYLEFIGTNPKHIGCGYAKLLLNKFLSDNQNKTIYLHVMSNMPYTNDLIHWYSKNNFKIVGYLENAITMIKFLNFSSEQKFWKVKNADLTNDKSEWRIY